VLKCEKNKGLVSFYLLGVLFLAFRTTPRTPPTRHALVLVFLHSRECLHANLFVPDPGRTPPGAIHLRSVLYGLEKHDSFVERMAAEKQHLGAVHRAADEFFRSRLEDEFNSLDAGALVGAP